MPRLILAALVVAVVGVAPISAAPQAVPRALVGKWTIGAGNSITFKSNGRVVFKLGAEVIDETASGTPTRVTFGPAGVCPGRGTYRWKLAGKRLTFRTVSDACSIRDGFVSGTWVRK